MTVRLLAIGDADAAATILRESFPEPMHPYLPLAQHGTAHYLRSFFMVPQESVARRAFVAIEDGQVAGYAEFGRPSSDVTFLSYICVAEAARGRGLATRLIEHGVGEVGAARLALDVFDDNVPAMRLYESLGLVEEGARRVWSRRELPPAGPSAGRAMRPHIAAACHDAYGFSELDVEIAGQPMAIGLIGETVIRCPSADVLSDDAALGALKSLLPTRTEAITIDEHAPDGADVLVRSVRLATDRDAIVKRAKGMIS